MPAMNKSLVLAALLVAAPSAQAASTVTLDTTGAEVWLACTEAVRAPEQCNTASASTEGGKFAELAIPTFGKLPVEHPADPSAAEAKALLQAVKSWDFGQLTNDIRALFPNLGPHTARVFIVGNGAHDWGDAYVRNYRYENGTPVLDDNGEPIILINLRLVARYKGTTAQKAEILRNILHHELFHIHFALAPRGKPGMDQTGAAQQAARFVAACTRRRDRSFPGGRANAEDKRLSARPSPKGPDQFG